MSALLAAILTLLPAAGFAQPAEPKTDDEKTLYALGVALGRNVQSFGLTEAEVRFVQAGLADAATGAKPKVEFSEFAPKIDALARARQTERAAKEKEKSKAYLEKAAKEKGAQKSASGLILVPIAKGKGAAPKSTETVKVHYHGTLIDGSVFDSSVQRGQPATFPLNAVIPCWTEGVQKLLPGGKAKLVCPSDIAYGDQGRPPQIPGGATLVFEVELLEVVAPPKN